MIFFTSDYHYNHKSICRGTSTWDDKSTCRDFDTLDEMNNELVNSTNKLVKAEDTLIHLGDWSFGGHKSIPEFRNRLNCNDIRLIRGNHDHHLRKYEGLFTWIKDYHEFSHGKNYFCLFHYAMRVWNNSHHGSIHLYGHSHGNLEPLGRSIDVGWDVHKRPLLIDEIIEKMEKIAPHKCDHHGENTC